MVLTEVFLAASLSVLFERLASREFLDFAARGGLRKRLDKWEKKLLEIQKVLGDAHDKQYTKREVKKWLEDVEDLAYDVEDILDELATEAASVSTSTVRNPVPTCFTSNLPQSVVDYKRMITRVKRMKITPRFNELMKQKDKLELKENVGGVSNIGREDQLPTTCFLQDPVFGREKDAKAVLQLLFSQEHRDDAILTKVNVIPIVGMGGIGKTTLAQIVFNKEEVQKFFDLKVWVYVSQNYDVKTITKVILDSVGSEKSKDKDLNWLQVKLKERLHGKKFIIILDNVWDEDYEKWTLLCAPFEAGAPGSSIIITTRNQEVSLLVGAGTVTLYRLGLLSKEACLSTFAQHALGATDFSAHSELKDISEEIVGKCEGLPLAVKAVGSLLRVKQHPNEWKKVLNSEIWDIDRDREKSIIIPALMLSYHHLPIYLKRCFAYCSIFPKNYEFEDKQLVLLWMAEGLIQPRPNTEEMEDLGMKYVRDLLSRSLFQQSHNDKSRLQMHELINDLAKSVAGDTCFRMEDIVDDHRDKGSLAKRARHSSWLAGKYDGIEKFEFVSNLRCLRTFLHLMLPSSGNCYMSCDVPVQLLQKLRNLRVLSFRAYCITELPDSIRNLKHLRYLDLSETLIRSMPESITTLYNLQTLLLEKCLHLKNLPSMLGNLVNLRHLNIQGAIHLEGMHVQIGKLTRLRTLSNMVVGKNSCSGIKELGSLRHLQGTLCISRLENMTKSNEAECANLNSNPKIADLTLEWSEDIDESEDRASELEVLEKLKPHESLEELTIRYYGGANFPTWLSCPSFSNLVFLTIENCEMCTTLPRVGQLPLLKVLSIGGMNNVKDVGHLEFCGDHDVSKTFRSLEILSFENMREWKNWNSSELEFPKLHELSLRSCPRLEGYIPNHLPSLKKVQIYDCEELNISDSNFPDLCEVEIEGSKGVVGRSMVEFNSLEIKSLSENSRFKSQTEGFDMQAGLTKVEDLTIFMCEEWTYLWSTDMRSLPHLPFLRHLRIDRCPKLVSLVSEEVEERLQQGGPLMLTQIEIKNCIALESLPKAMIYNNTCLKLIRIVNCDSLEHIARGQLPPTLERIEVSKCKNMKIFLEDNDANSRGNATSLLEYLEIYNCPSLELLTSSGELPATLKSLRMGSCPKLGSIATSLQQNSFLERIDVSFCEKLKSLPKGIHSLSSLAHIYIQRCQSLEFSRDEESLLPANLRVLQISECEKILALPDGIHNLTSLQQLRIQHCPVLVCFTEENVLTNLTSLEISHIQFTDDILECGFENLTSLIKLEIGGYQHQSFPEMRLPTSLKSLSISESPELLHLSYVGFRKLESLEELFISNCGKFTSFPKGGLPLKKLVKLYICKCEKLKSFPNNGLPRSLLQLFIFKCPLLEERYKKDRGREWRKIAHIPCIKFHTNLCVF
ncbi:putative disease resistance RPP13-like protein 1 [Juglans microcarpa x Juglans regia]|uniref:putative disease resistance RPP13-like protein 1 n=1 Tax=Juglans microcarpa x Juglans regia TaxID=2249226 RepID=UPI001B7EE333|nr:putative disease resistance RPP13-like protein 1 [Juglans microcarpa x Juglans regia]